MVIQHTCDPALWRLRQKDHVFKASWGYKATPCLQKPKKTGKQIYSRQCKVYVVERVLS
jgi:hypothetical protein